jgi:hypothetical protein
MRFTFTALALLLASSCAFGQAGGAYATSVPPPSGWLNTGGGGSFRNTAANAERFAGRVVANVTTTVEGRLLTMPASMRFAANAGQIVTNAFRFNPYLLVGSLALAWMADLGLEYAEEKWWKTEERDLECNAYKAFGAPAALQWYCTPGEAARAYVRYLNQETPSVTQTCPGPVFVTFSPAFEVVSFSSSSVVFKRKGLNCSASPPVAAYADPEERTWQRSYRIAKDTQRREAGDPDFTTPPDKVVPPEIPPMLPDDFPMPTRNPSLNPGPGPDYLPNPVRFPNGDPVPVPGSNPATWNKPYIDIIPAPTPGDPWRIIVQPGYLPEPNPNPLPDVVGTPAPGAGGNPNPLPVGNPGTGPAQEFYTCGLPGKPPCKIDESGTPEDMTDVEAIAAPGTSGVKDFISGIPGTIFPNIAWSFALPSNCGPLTIGAFSQWMEPIDICEFQPMFHDIMTMVWAIGGLFGAIGIFWRDQMAGT